MLKERPQCKELEEVLPLLYQLAYQCLRKFTGARVVPELEELVNEGVIAYYKARETFDERKDVQFTTYLRLVVVGRLSNILDNEMTRIRHTLHGNSNDFDSATLGDEINGTRPANMPYSLGFILDISSADELPVEKPLTEKEKTFLNLCLNPPEELREYILKYMERKRSCKQNVYIAVTCFMGLKPTQGYSMKESILKKVDSRGHTFAGVA